MFDHVVVGRIAQARFHRVTGNGPVPGSDKHLQSEPQKKGVAMKEEPWHRRHAVQIAAQLPERYEDAIAVLRAAERLAEDYLKDPDTPSRSVIRLREV
jgi:hypothetical protein